MKLSVLERVVLSNLLPKEGSFSNLKISKELQNDIGFTAEENKKLNFRVTNDKLVWDETVEEVNFVFNSAANNLIVESLKTLDKNKMLSIEQISLFEKFIKEF